MQEDDGSIVAPPPHGLRPRESHAIDAVVDVRGGRPKIYGVLPTGNEVSGLSGVRVPREGTQTGKTHQKTLVNM